MSEKLTNNVDATMDLWWVTDPPIFEITEVEYAARLRTLGDSLTGWNAKVSTDNLGPGDVAARDWQTPKRTQQALWNDRVDANDSMLAMMGSPSFGLDTYAAEYRVAGVAVGIIIVDSSPTIYVDELLTHTGTAGAGGLLIEHIVKKAFLDWGGNGKMKLYALDGDAAIAYRALGFTGGGNSVGGGGNMELDPARSPLWAKMNGTYVLQKTAGTQKFIS